MSYYNAIKISKALAGANRCVIDSIMFEKAFKKLEPEDAAKTLSLINPKLDGSPFESDAVAVLTQRLPFYPGYEFLEVTDHAANPLRVQYVIFKPEDPIILNWTNEPIYDLNSRLPIGLDKDNVGLYVKFFFTYVRGRHGRFLIVDGVDDIRWKDDPPPAARKAVGEMIQPVTLQNIGEDGTYNLKACMIFKDSLFQSAVHVKPDGHVSMSDEELLVEDMPVIDDLLGI